jgi:hypothetical protein
LGVSVPIAPPTPEEIEPEWETFLSGLPLTNVDWEKSTEEGQAATAIAHQAERLRADMIAIGMHGRSGLPHMLLGSVAEKVLRAATCPVLTIKPDAFQFALPSRHKREPGACSRNGNHYWRMRPTVVHRRSSPRPRILDLRNFSTLRIHLIPNKNENSGT